MKFILYSDLYLCDIYVFFGKPDGGKLHSLLKPLEKYGYNRKEYEDNMAGKAGMVSYFGANVVLWAEEIPKTPKTLSVLVHEIFHVAVAICRRAGMDFSDDSEEAYAYLAGWIARKIFQKLRDTEAVKA